MAEFRNATIPPPKQSEDFLLKHYLCVFMRFWMINLFKIIYAKLYSQYWENGIIFWRREKNLFR